MNSSNSLIGYLNCYVILYCFCSYFEGLLSIRYCYDAKGVLQMHHCCMNMFSCKDIAKILSQHPNAVYFLECPDTQCRGIPLFG